MKPKAARKRPSKQTPAQPLDRNFTALAEAFANDRRVTHGRLMASYGLKVNGKIFCMLVRGQFVAKLPKNRVDELVGAGRGKRFDPGHGRLMKEWIVFEGEKAHWVGLAKEALAFVGRLHNKSA